jgi:hypothetical protein
MEVNCQRCQAPIDPENSYCSACGLPQLTYSSEETPGPVSQQPWHEGGDDAGEVVWRTALRVALFMSIPAGFACSIVSPLGSYGFVWMAIASAWVVAIYVRRVQPPWITAGAGVRIGLVAGIFSAWFSFIISSGTLFTQRFFFHQGAEIDSQFKLFVVTFQKSYLPLVQQMNPDPAELAKAQAFVAWMRAPEGQAGLALLNLTIVSVILLIISMIGGVVGARLSARSRKHS